MTATLDETTGSLNVETFEEIFASILVSAQTGLGLTAAQTTRLEQNLRSSLGQIFRIIAERDAANDEALLVVFNTLSWYAEGVALDNVCSLLGVTRLAAARGTASVVLTGTPAADVDAGTRLLHVPTDTVWTVDDAGVIGGGGTLSAALTEEAEGAAVLTDPVAADWTLLTTNNDVTDVVTTEQTLVGRSVELDADLRVRGAAEAYKRGQGPIAAITGRLLELDGVTFVAGRESLAVSAADTDSLGVPARAVHFVVRGGATADIAAVLATAKAAGIYLHADTGASYVESQVTLSNGSLYTARFNRDTDVDVWVTYVATTSESEETPAPNIIAELDAFLAENLDALFGIGKDVLPAKIEGLITASSLSVGVDDIQVTLSLDDGAADAYTRARRAMAFSETPVFDPARISGTEA